MIAALACLLLAIPTHLHEGDAQAFASLTDAKGRPLADSRYSQWIEGGLLHLQTRSDFPGGRTVVEHATLRLHPQLEQESWEWSEKNGDRLVRTYQVDFKTGKAVATRVDRGRSLHHPPGEPGDREAVRHRARSARLAGGQRPRGVPALRRAAGRARRSRHPHRPDPGRERARTGALGGEAAAPEVAAGTAV